MGMILFERDVKKKPIEARVKDGKSYELDGDGRFCGHRFILKHKMYGDKRCLYCGKWFHWDQRKHLDWVNDGNIDTYNNDDNIEPLHCGSSPCQEYHHLTRKAAKDIDAEMDRRGIALMKKLRGKGVL